MHWGKRYQAAAFPQPSWAWVVKRRRRRRKNCQKQGDPSSTLVAAAPAAEAFCEAACTGWCWGGAISRHRVDAVGPRQGSASCTALQGQMQAGWGGRTTPAPHHPGKLSYMCLLPHPSQLLGPSVRAAPPTYSPPTHPTQTQHTRIRLNFKFFCNLLYIH